MKIELKELIDIEEVLKALSKLPDYRRVEKKIEYKHGDIIFGVMCSMFLLKTTEKYSKSTIMDFEFNNFKKNIFIMNLESHTLRL